ncbi:hypothetical protein RQP46_008148 [Phenoliferia psychrophenolica]
MSPSSFIIINALALLIVGVAAAPAGLQAGNDVGEVKRWYRDHRESPTADTTYEDSVTTYDDTDVTTYEGQATTYYEATTTDSATAPTSTPTSTGDFVPANLTDTGITGFLGKNTGIASWFRTDNTGDSTNGHSWCGSPYDDSVPGFAPSVTTMLKNFGNDWVTAGTAYCGLEAIFTTPSGLNATLYLVDGFADPWVLTPGSIDVVTGSFPLLRGYQTTSKDDVVQDVAWTFTGRRNELYKFKGVGSG